MRAPEPQHVSLYDDFSKVFHENNSYGGVRENSQVEEVFLLNEECNFFYQSIDARGFVWFVREFRQV